MTVDGSGPVTPGDPTPEAAEPTPPSLTPTGDDRVAVLAAYLRSHAGRYTGEALARAATAAGYSDAEVTAAQAIADSTWQGATHGIRPKFHLGVVTSAAIAYVVVLYAAISTSASRSSDVSGTVAIGGLVLGVVTWALLRRDHPSLARGIGCGVIAAIVIPIVTVLVIVGICIVSGTYPSGP
jgi:hypothetical protein